ncbi:MAG: glucose 1-dehydrogenase [Porticoccaceae bacterium]|jgi:3alpha(or 20beta)-hydroxysteroid dehydrogenase|nr:glucose 1-dehydrogenase [Pseudomonadota bacterium]
MGRLQDRVAIITGGSRGMGEATVRRFVAEGAKVVVGDVLDEQGRALAASLGDSCRYHPLDVTREDQWEAIVRFAEETFGGVDVLVNNAGILHVASVRETTLADFQRIIAINQIGPFLGMRAVIEPMKKRGKGSIVNISSLEGFRSKNGLMAYSATKWAVRGMTKAAALELGAYNIRVNSVHPGAVFTPMVGATSAEPGPAENAMCAGVPLKRIGLPVEIANMSLFLASDESSYCNGSEYLVDGGWNAGEFVDQLPTS